MNFMQINIFNNQKYYEIRTDKGEIFGFALGEEQLLRFIKEAREKGEDIISYDPTNKIRMVDTLR